MKGKGVCGIVGTESRRKEQGIDEGSRMSTLGEKKH